MDRALIASVGFTGALLALLSLPAVAQSSGDPTQPPAQLKAAPDAGGTADVPVAPGLQLQSILISRNPGGRKVAVINGQMVRVGERFGDAMVVDMTRTELVLGRGKTREILKLFPQTQPAAGKGQQ